MPHIARLLQGVPCHGSWSTAVVFAIGPRVASSNDTRFSIEWTSRLSAVRCSGFLEASPPCAFGAGLVAQLGFPLFGRAAATVVVRVVALF